MNIIEKLRITPGPWIAESPGFIGPKDEPIVECSGTISDCNLIAAAPEMLEALIEYCYSSDVFEQSMKENGLDIQPDSFRYSKIIPIIEKACNKSWEEIKELLQ